MSTILHKQTRQRRGPGRVAVKIPQNPDNIVYECPLSLNDSRHFSTHWKCWNVESSLIIDVIELFKTNFNKKNYACVDKFSFPKVLLPKEFSKVATSSERIFQSGYDKRLQRQILLSNNFFVETEIIDFIKILKFG